VVAVEVAVMAEAPAYKGSMGWKLLLLCVGLTLCISPGLVCGDQATLGYPQSAPATSHTAHFPQQEVTAPLGYPSSYPVEGADTGLTASGSQYYSNYPTGGGGGQYDYGLQYGDTDRQDVSLFTFPMVITAFFSAMMGGLLAPLVVNVAARMGDFELPVLPDIGDLEVPEFPIKRVNQKKKKTKKGRDLMADSIVGLISRGLKHLNSDQTADDQHHAD